MKKIIKLVVFAIIAFCGYNLLAVDVLMNVDKPKQNTDFKLNFNFKLDGKEHIYASENVDFGLPTKIKISLPEGYTLKSIKFPPAKDFVFMNMKSKGYSTDFTAVANVSAPAKFYDSKMVEGVAEIEMLACSEQCQPVKKILKFKLPASKATTKEDLILFTTLLGAFLGGIILNLMPCVFPVISIKVMSFAKTANDRTATILGAVAYSVGIIFSFVILALLLIVLRATGAGLGWGFQLQNPVFASLMALLFFAMALSFAGVYEIGAGIAGKLIGATSDNKNNIISSALSGVLAVLVASPCTAPFMGASVGAALAFDTPTWLSIAIFVSLGLGMAFPYILLASIPALAKKMPKPDVWMEKLKHILSIPLFCTVGWLTWVYMLQTGRLTPLILSLFVLAGGLFVYGKFTLPHLDKKIRLIAMAVCALTIAISVWLPAHFAKPSELDISPENQWSSTKLETLRNEGKIVYVDFTAAWCLTCQYNKIILNSEKIEKFFREKNVVVLVGDWTNRNPEIAKELEIFGRAGVPLNLVYPADKSKKPIILPSILTESDIIQAVDKAAR